MQQTDINKSGSNKDEAPLSESKLRQIQELQQGSKPKGEVQEQKQPSFVREIDSFYCQFSLTNQNSLKIVLNSSLDASVYLLQLTKQQKKASEELNFFESIAQIFQYIQQNTTESLEIQEQKMIKIDQLGKISLTVISTIGKKERHREIFLPTKRIQENRQVYLQKLIKRISKNLVQLRKQVSVMKQKYDSFQDKNQQLLHRLKSQGQKLEFKCSKSDPHYQKFKFSQRKITKALDDTSYFNLISQLQITKTGVSYFNIKILNSPNKNIIVGIGSKFIRGIQNAYTHPDFIGLYIYGQGYIWQKTNQREIDLRSHSIENGIVITTVVDMDLGYVYWQICKVRVAYAVIPLQLKAKMLLPVVMMINVNDTIMLP